MSPLVFRQKMRVCLGLLVSFAKHTALVHNLFVGARPTCRGWPLDGILKRVIQCVSWFERFAHGSSLCVLAASCSALTNSVHSQHDSRSLPISRSRPHAAARRCCCAPPTSNASAPATPKLSILEATPMAMAVPRHLAASTAEWSTSQICLHGVRSRASQPRYVVDADDTEASERSDLPPRVVQTKSNDHF